MGKYRRDDIMNALMREACIVTFKKASDNTMTSAKFAMTKDVPAFDGPQGGYDKAKVTAWNVDKKAWRSFFVENVEDVRAAPGGGGIGG